MVTLGRVHRVVWAAVVSAGLILESGCAPKAAPPPVRVEARPWPQGGPDGVELITDHFHLRLTARDPALRAVLPAFLEAAHGEYARIIPPTGPDPRRLPVYLFETRQEWVRFTRRFAPAQADTYLHIQAGGYTDQRTGIAAAFDISRDRTLSLLAHEGFHQYAALHLPEPLPAWLNEGLACQFEAFRLEGDRPAFTPRRNLLRLEALREALTLEEGFIPPARLLRMDAGQAVRDPGRSTRMFYAQLWSTVLYLREPSGPYARGFAALLADAGTPRLKAAIRARRLADPTAGSFSDPEIAFHCYITPDLDGFMAGYRAFAEALAR
jgi:hypothetical protein